MEWARADAPQRRRQAAGLWSEVEVAKPHDEDTLEKTRAFWNASPCGAQESFRQRLAHRYGVEPWVKDVLEQIAARHPHVVEVGCGQGTDGITLSTLLPHTGSYFGVDYSDDSVLSANRAKREATTLLTLNIEPVFRRMNAEQLDLPTESVPCVYSNGVLHHTAQPRRAYEEVWRVVAPGGEAFLTLYRKPSLKVGIAQGIRRLQATLDHVFGTDRCLYRLISGRKPPELVGTMFLEGFGVPVMEWYSEADIMSIFRKWDILTVAPVGCNVPRLHPRSRGWTRWGYMWFVHLRKPHTTALANSEHKRI
jgi:SAM-dependent methyltransferase